MFGSWSWFWSFPHLVFLPTTCVFALVDGEGSLRPDILTTGYFHYFGFMEGLIFGEMFAMGGWVGGGGGFWHSNHRLTTTACLTEAYLLEKYKYKQGKHKYKEKGKYKYKDNNHRLPHCSRAAAADMPSPPGLSW